MNPRNAYGVGLLPAHLAERIAKGMTTTDDVMEIEQVIAAAWHRGAEVGERGAHRARVVQRRELPFQWAGR